MYYYNGLTYSIKKFVKFTFFMLYILELWKYWNYLVFCKFIFHEILNSCFKVSKIQYHLTHMVFSTLLKTSILRIVFFLNNFNFNENIVFTSKCDFFSFEILWNLRLIIWKMSWGLSEKYFTYVIKIRITVQMELLRLVFVFIS